MNKVAQAGVSIRVARQSLDAALGRLRTVAAVQTLGGLPDAQLLERFVAQADEAAFTVLLERHGPMVLGVCRRALSDRHDAEDACQATFLVLARQAGSLRKKASLSSWLHGVACRVTAGLKRDAARRKRRERLAQPGAPADPASEVTWREVQAALDEEMQRLPERHRAPLILCYLECLTRDEAAARLGLSPGALHGRLERGRELLRGRLTRRGLALSAALSAVTLSESVACALPPAFVVTSARAAALLAAGQPITDVVSAGALALTREVIKSMSFTKWKLGAAALMGAALLALAGGSFAPLGFGQEQKTETRETLAKTESDEEFIRRLSKDLRGSEPTPAEVHFFVASKEPRKRDKLIDLFVQERQAKKQVRYRTTVADLTEMRLKVRTMVNLKAETPRLESLQKDFYKELQSAKEKADVAKITQAYLDRLIAFVKANPKSPDLAGAVRQIVLVYESQGKTVEADAWRAKVPKDGAKSPSRDDKGR